jgi:ribosomal protein S12 methylthiotransferase
LVFGPDELGRILEAVQEPDQPGISIDALYTSREVPTIPRLRTTPAHMAYLKISEGCDHTCSFCAIPGFRGAFRSRSATDLVSEARRLAEDGARELILVSQDTLAGGRDLGETGGIVSLLEALLEVEGPRWIRLLYCYPNLLTDEIVGLIAGEERLCSYFDIPFQHASAPVLGRMRRGGGRNSFLRQLHGLRDRVPDAAIRTSFIVGFPGETDSDFGELEQFVDEAGFDNMGVFLYSDEEGTGAYSLEGKVARRTAVRRRDRLMKLQAGIVRRRLSRFVGQTLPVLLEGPAEESELLLAGRTEGQAPEIDGRVLINDSELRHPNAGEFYRTEITEVVGYDLLGHIVGTAGDERGPDG